MPKEIVNVENPEYIPFSNHSDYPNPGISPRVKGIEQEDGTARIYNDTVQVKDAYGNYLPGVITYDETGNPIYH